MIRVLIVDEVRLTCDVISAALQNQPDIEVTGSATCLDEAITRLDTCDVVVVSNTLPEHGALAVTRAAKAHAQSKVLVLGLADSKDEVLPYVEAGAAGYLLKDDSIEELLRNIRAAYSDEAIIPPNIAAAIIARLAELAKLCREGRGIGVDQDAIAATELTSREREIMELIAEGLSNRDIALRLTIELGTVKNHVHNILRKLNASSRREAVARLAEVQTPGSERGSDLPELAR